MRIDELDYELPEELIAQVPLEERSSSRLLCLDRQSGALRHMVFRDIVNELQMGDLLVLNDTKVSALRLLGKKESGGNVEALMMREASDAVFECLLRPAKRLRPGTRILFADGLSGIVLDGEVGPYRVIRLEGANWRQALSLQGLVPLPPYVHETLADAQRYQTVYAAKSGSAAAPTAGLHFTPEVLANLQKRGVSISHVTLDVSLDTFRPVQSETVEGHDIHGETCEMPASTAEAINGCTGRVVAVGTTSVRTIESFSVGSRQVVPGRKKTKIYITPGYTFQNVEAILTNFHLPRTTMLAMLSAFCPQEYLFRAYREAVIEKYRFLSFGDAMFLS